jgi:hypothetical protein
LGSGFWGLFCGFLDYFSEILVFLIYFEKKASQNGLEGTLIRKYILIASLHGGPKTLAELGYAAIFGCFWRFVCK